MLGGLFTNLVQNPRRVIAKRAVDSARRSFARGRTPMAHSLASFALRLDDRYADAHEMLGLIAGENGDAEEAVRYFRKAIRLSPTNVRLYNHAGLALIKLGWWKEAGADFAKAIEVCPEFPEAHCNLGIVNRHRGALDRATENFSRAYSIAPGLPEMADNYAMVLREQEQYEAAEAVLRRAMVAGLAHEKLSRDLAVVLRETGRLDEAAHLLGALLEKRPSDGKSWSLLGLVERDRGRFAESDAAFAKALSLMPGDDSLRLRRALSLLLRGRFEEGWTEYEGRYGTEETPDRGMEIRRWAGNPVDGALLVYSEQGLGDEIMFASCVPDVLAVAPRCILECSPRLEALFARSFPGVQVVSGKRVKNPGWMKDTGGIDFQVAAGSLPGYFRRSWDDFPRHNGYLRADPGRVQAWRDRLAALGSGPKVGVSWRGGVGKTMKRLRSIELSQWAAVLSLPGFAFVSLQYGDVGEELERVSSELGVKIQCFPNAIDDLDEMAALICALDRVVSVCNATVHLAGALGRPALVLVSATPEWRYLAEGNAMPWYPAVRLIRKGDRADWRQAMDIVHEELASLAA
jgi:Flp pilus assembly protein TadD